MRSCVGARVHMPNLPPRRDVRLPWTPQRCHLGEISQGLVRIRWAGSPVSLAEFASIGFPL